MVARRSKPGRAPVCGHDRHAQSLRMSDERRVVRDVRLTRLPAPVVLPPLRGLRIEFTYQRGPDGLKVRGQLGVDLA